MGSVSIRELRNNGGRVLDRVAGGERVTVTRDGTVVAELSPAPRTPVDPQTLLQRWRHLPVLDPVALRTDVDEVVDTAL